MKKKDIIVIAIILVIACVGYGIYYMMQGDVQMVDIYYHSEVVKQVDINKDGIYTIEGDYGSFSLEVKDGQYHATDVECPNHDCEKVGWVSKGSAKQIVCVPNDIYVLQSDQIDNNQY